MGCCTCVPDPSFSITTLWRKIWSSAGLTILSTLSCCQGNRFQISSALAVCPQLLKTLSASLYQGLSRICTTVLTTGRWRLSQIELMKGGKPNLNNLSMNRPKHLQSQLSKEEWLTRPIISPLILKGTKSLLRKELRKLKHKLKTKLVISLPRKFKPIDLSLPSNLLSPIQTWSILVSCKIWTQRKRN